MDKRKKSYLIAVMALLLSAYVIYSTFVGSKVPPKIIALPGEVSQVNYDIDIKETATAVNQLGISMLKTHENTNAIISPIGVSQILSLAEHGADGETKSQIQQGTGSLRIDNYSQKLAQLYARSKEDNAFNIANGVWLKSECEVLPSYLEAIKPYNGQVATVNYMDYAKVQQEINEYTKSYTNGKVTDLVQVVREFMDMTISSGVSFAGSFKKPLNNVSMQDFNGVNGTKSVEMFSGDIAVNYFENDILTLIQIPFAGDSKFYFNVILPKGNIADVENLSALELEQYIGLTTITNVNVSMPKIVVNENTRLNENLKAIGINLAFDSNKGTFTNMVQNKIIYLNQAVHKVQLDIDHGNLTNDQPTKLTKTFVANKPFIFSVYNKEIKTNLIHGKIVNQ